MSSAKVTGRPKIVIDWDLVDGMAKIQCTQEEIAAVLGVSIDTLNRASKREFKETFAAHFAQRRAEGRKSLRRALMQRAIQGSDACLIFACKNYCDMSDNQRVELSSAEDTKRRFERLISGIAE